MHTRFESLPELLRGEDGNVIGTAIQWEQNRRPEIVELFRDCVYGKEPLHPDNSRFSVVSNENMMDGRATRKQVNVTLGGPQGECTIQLLLFVPNHISKPVPVFLLMNIAKFDPFAPASDTKSSFWPAEYIVSRGYAAAIFQVADIDPDHDDGFHNGVHGIFDPINQPRPANAWATIGAWAWGAGRVLDYFESDPDIDSARVALVGHSRGGKAALWAGAIDQRFAMVVSNNSGCTGAALSRGKIGEKVKDINTTFPHWFAENYKKYNDREDELPVDQHMLLALIAPRLLYVTSASEDTWADPQSEFLSLTLAQPVYQLYGDGGLPIQQFPPNDTPIRSLKLGYHVRTGEHQLAEFDWQCFMDFADANL